MNSERKQQTLETLKALSANDPFSFVKSGRKVTAYNENGEWKYEDSAILTGMMDGLYKGYRLACVSPNSSN